MDLPILITVSIIVCFIVWFFLMDYLFGSKRRMRLYKKFAKKQVLTNEEFRKKVMKLSKPARLSEPTATYSYDGQCIEFFVSHNDFYGEYVNDFLTLYKDRETDEVMGCVISGIKCLYYEA